MFYTKSLKIQIAEPNVHLKFTITPYWMPHAQSLVSRELRAENNDSWTKACAYASALHFRLQTDRLIDSGSLVLEQNFKYSYSNATCFTRILLLFLCPTAFCFSIPSFTRLFCIDHILLTMASHAGINLVLQELDTAQREFQAELNALKSNQNRRFAALRERVNRLRVNQVVECMGSSSISGVLTKTRSFQRGNASKNDQADLAVSEVSSISNGDIFSKW